MTETIKDEGGYVLVWTSRYGREAIIDEADTRPDAEYLQREYQMAYGEGVVTIHPKGA